ncbi:MULTISPECIES: RNA-guided endonuclease InsQ/TnpB family protein [Metallosphaera]|uniref:Transposase, IS605 OrfB family n=3 Tax=Metallosphaera TaxID=41980 RepID=A4YGW8_METS5|nr:MULTISPECIES: RNA-guided endonuclease TnpB family protein [Metallosphaera]ABP95670.1 transposase, IS605 OrfB family [Metallosphaera sedula DSM 5348]AIM27654.1 transposase, IS605 OrfB family [Metallosphaera sedula]AKV74511.1 transposase [Metallosphaera sedula]AKV76750.1 transposase [Metallosphaera sedula]AKV79001.1 transposase [Metallosphaera sedula]
MKSKGNKVTLSFKYRAYPTPEVERKLINTMEIEAKVYNKLLNYIAERRKQGIKVTQLDTQKLLKDMDEKHEVYSKALQMVNNVLWYNINALAKLKRNGKKIGKLRHKKAFKIVWYNQSGFKLQGDKLHLSKIGEIKLLLHRPIQGEVKGVILKRSKTNKWYAIFQVEQEKQPLERTGRVVGIDLGVEKFVTTSDGDVIENPKLLDRREERIKLLQRRLSRKRRGSRNYEKARAKLAMAYERLENTLNDYIHKITTWLVKDHDVIVVEKLNTREMVQDSLGRLRKHILYSSFSTFLHHLSYKAERAGRRVVEVDPAYTSQTCSRCGYRVKLSLSDRVFRCPSCGLVIDRDYNASLNILKRGVGTAPLPVEGEPLLFTFHEVVYSKFPQRSRKSSPRGGDAPSVRAE